MREVECEHPDSVAMRTGQRLDLDVRYGSPESEPGPHPTANDISVFFVAYTDDGEAIGSGALRKLDDQHAEIKRMFEDFFAAFETIIHKNFVCTVSCWRPATASRTPCASTSGRGFARSRSSASTSTASTPSASKKCSEGRPAAPHGGPSPCPGFIPCEIVEATTKLL